MQRSPTEPTLSAEAADPARGRVAHVVGRPPLGRYRSTMPARSEIVEAAGRKVAVSNPDKVMFAGPGYTKRDLVAYYLVVADGALRGAGGRPMALKRYVNGADGDFFFQKRAPNPGPIGSGRSSCRFHPVEPPTKWWSTTRPGWPGSPTSAAWTSTPMRSGRTILSTPTSCAWIWIRYPESRGAISGAWRW